MPRQASPAPPHAPKSEDREKALGDLAKAAEGQLLRKDTSQNEVSQNGFRR